MTINALKQVLFDKTSEYWAGATVAWGNAAKVKPLASLVLLRMGPLTRSNLPAEVVGDGIVFRAYPSETTFTVDLFTKGKAADVPPGAVQTRENTAVGDLTDFANFLSSTASTWWAARHDIDVTILGGVTDLSEVINDSQWQYRAVAEFAVNFTQWNAEANGVLSEDSIVFDDDGDPVGVNRPAWQPNASGGGSREIADEELGYFTSAKVEHVKPDKEGNNG